MPKHYAGGTFKVICNLANAGDSFILKEWTSKANISICEEHGHPKIKMGFLIENESDPLSPLMFYISDKDAYEGGIHCIQNGNSFEFTLDGKFKFSLHKDVLEKLTEGKKTEFEGVSYLRCEHSAEGCIVADNDLNFSEKAL